MKTVIKHEGIQVLALLDDNGLGALFRFEHNLHLPDFNALVVKALITESQLERIRNITDPIAAAKLLEARASYMETESPKTWEALKWRT